MPIKVSKSRKTTSHLYLFIFYLYQKTILLSIVIIATIESMVSQIFVSLVFFFILLYASINLLGFLVRGLFVDPDLERLKKDGHEFIKNEIRRSQRVDKLVNVIALILNIVYFYLLFHFWNIGVVIVAGMIMMGRLPYLLWEIQHGRKIKPELMKKDVLYYVTSFLPWIGLPLLYFSLYHI